MKFRGNYVLTLYCDKRVHTTVQQGHFAGRSMATCLRQAQRKGWRVHLETKTATCPDCARKPKRRVRPNFKVEIKGRRGCASPSSSS